MDLREEHDQDRPLDAVGFMNRALEVIGAVFIALIVGYLTVLAFSLERVS